MTLTEAGESRIRGYLFVLGRSLRTFLPTAVAEDAVREVESHIRERIEQIEDRDASERRAEAAVPVQAAKAGAERAVVEAVLAELGPPLRVARAYAQEMTLDEAETTGRVVPMARALWYLATTSFYGFFWAIGALIGYSMGVALLAIAVLKPIFPNNVGFIVSDASAPGLHALSVPRFSLGFVLERSFTLGALFPLPPGAVAYGGYWVIPISIVAGLVVLVTTHRLSRRMLGWLRSRRSAGRLRVRLTVDPA